jgi:hypothetical protein
MASNSGDFGATQYRRIWDGFRKQQYQCKGFETLHFLSIAYYERDLCRIHSELFENSGFRQDEEKSKLKRMRQLLRNHGMRVLLGEIGSVVDRKVAEACRSLETVLQREKNLPKGLVTRNDNHDRLTTLGPDKWALEHYDHYLQQPPKLDTLRKTVQNITPYPFLTSAAREKDSEANPGANMVNSNDPPPVVQAEGNNDIFNPVSPAQERFARFIACFLGGASLLVPMILMTFKTQNNTRLIIVSCFVLFFGFMVSVFTEASNQEALGAVAAYAAVMVVYVGSASPSNGTSSG